MRPSLRHIKIIQFAVILAFGLYLVSNGYTYATSQYWIFLALFFVFGALGYVEGSLE